MLNLCKEKVVSWKLACTGLAYLHLLINVLLVRCATLLLELESPHGEIFAKFLNSALIRSLVRVNASPPTFLIENSPIQRSEKASDYRRTTARSDVTS
jgi:hypothetical protein